MRFSVGCAGEAVSVNTSTFNTLTGTHGAGSRKSDSAKTNYTVTIIHVMTSMSSSISWPHGASELHWCSFKARASTNDNRSCKT